MLLKDANSITIIRSRSEQRRN